MTALRAATIAGRLLWRDWRGGELGLLAAALVVAVATVTGISAFVDRLGRALLAESANFLAADRVVTGSRPVPQAWRDIARDLDLRTADTVVFPSIVFAGETSQLASVKAVSDGYPLRGALVVADAPFAPATERVRSGPRPGEAWLDSRLFPALDLDVGATVEVGRLQLTVTRAIINEPDRGGGFYGLGPRLMMHVDDVAASGIVQPGSRVQYRWLVAGEEVGLTRLHAGLITELAPNGRWLGVREGSPCVGDALARAESFLLLGGLQAVILAGIAIALSARRYARRQLDHVAVLKTLGLGPRAVRALYGTMLLLLGALAVTIGLALGTAAQVAATAITASFMPVALPPPGLRPFAVGALSGAVCLLAFALPTVIAVAGISPMRVVRREFDAGGLSTRLAWLGGAAGVLVLLLWYSGSVALTGWVLLGAAAVAVVLGGLTWLALRAGRALGMQAGSAVRLAMAGMQRRGVENAVQVVTFALAIMLMLMLVLIRTGLIQEWQAQLPKDAPNHFAMNIAPDELPALLAMLGEQSPSIGQPYPMMMARATHVNGTPIAEWEASRAAGDGPDPRISSERNVSHARTVPDANTVVAGEFWAPDTAEMLVSLDADYARSAGVAVGDTIRYAIADREVETRVTSLRRIEWDSMQPNFYVLFSPPVLEDVPSTWLLSFNLDRADKPFLNRLLRAFPTVTVLELDALIAQVQSIIEQVSRAIEVVLVLVLGAGALVLVATVRAGLDERIAEQALIRTLGAPRRLIQGALAVEFLAIGAFAGALAAVGAEVSAWALASEVFDLQPALHPWTWVAGPLVGATLILALGMFATRRVVSTPPMVVLRSMDGG